MYRHWGDLRERYDIDYVRMKTIYDGKEQWASLDVEYDSPKEMYNIMREGNRVLTTQVPYDEFEHTNSLEWSEYSLRKKFARFDG